MTVSLISKSDSRVESVWLIWGDSTIRSGRSAYCGLSPLHVVFCCQRLAPLLTERVRNFVGVSLGQVEAKNLNLMGRRNRSRFFKGLDVQSPDIEQLKQVCKILNISWPALQRTGSDLSPAVQGSTLNSNAMETNASRS